MMHDNEINWELELSELLDGSLDGQRLQRLRLRLAQDPALREQLRQYQAAQAELAMHLPMAADELPVDDARLLEQREAIASAMARKALLARRRRPMVFRLFTGALAAAAAFAVVAAVAMYFRQQPGDGGGAISVSIPAASKGPPAAVAVAVARPTGAVAARTIAAVGADAPITVEYRRMGDDEVDLSQPRAGGLPPGTVMVATPDMDDYEAVQFGI
jgi:anti-sigma factor RsiW